MKNVSQDLRKHKSNCRRLSTERLSLLSFRQSPKNPYKKAPSEAPKIDLSLFWKWWSSRFLVAFNPSSFKLSAFLKCRKIYLKIHGICSFSVNPDAPIKTNLLPANYFSLYTVATAWLIRIYRVKKHLEKWKTLTNLSKEVLSPQKHCFDFAHLNLTRRNPQCLNLFGW